VRAACDARVVIPLVPGVRSLNLSMAAAIAVAEAARQSAGRQPAAG
jgi:tRNA (cytidine/uridine-2'-O-)-methyltransferase